MVLIRSIQIHQKKQRPNDNMQPVKPSYHKKTRPVDTISNRKRRLDVLSRLKIRKTRPQGNCQSQCQNPLTPLPLHKRMMRPCHREARPHQNTSIHQRHPERGNGLNTYRRPRTPNLRRRTQCPMKKSSKNPKKNIPSDSKNNAKPNRRPRAT